MAGSVQERKRKLVLPAPPRRPSARGTQLNENAVLAQAVPHATDLAPSPRQSPGGPVSHPAHDLDWDDDLLGDNSFSAVYETLLQLRNLCALPADVSVVGMGGFPLTRCQPSPPEPTDDGAGPASVNPAAPRPDTPAGPMPALCVDAPAAIAARGWHAVRPRGSQPAVRGRGVGWSSACMRVAVVYARGRRGRPRHSPRRPRRHA